MLVIEADCNLVTLENILTMGMYNGIGLQVRDKMILLIEAQSTFSVNITLRILLYLAATCKEYAEEQKLNLYGTEAVTIPRPELYVVYTGDREDMLEILLLSDLYGGAGDVEIRVKVLRETGNGDIVNQAVRRRYGLSSIGSHRVTFLVVVCLKCRWGVNNSCRPRRWQYGTVGVPYYIYRSKEILSFLGKM